MIHSKIIDTDFLRSISPADLQLYLRSNHWLRSTENPDLWVLESENESAQIIVPRSNSMRGYVGFMRDALDTLSEVSGRSELEVVSDIAGTSRDIQYIRTHPDTNSGTTTILDGVQAFSSVKDWVLAGAVNVYSPNSSAVQPRRKPAQAIELLEHVRLGSTYPGSFVISVLFPLSPTNEPYLGLEHPNIDSAEVPPHRRVSATLAASTQAALDACVLALKTDDLAPFSDRIRSGVSANLCEALAGFGGSKGRPFSIDFSWATTYGQLPHQGAQFTPDHVSVLRAAADQFREDQPEEDVVLIGSVVRLHRESRFGPGEVSVVGTIAGDDSEKLYRVWVELEESDYRIATVAHEQGDTVTLNGSLARRGNRHRLYSANNFRVVP